MLNKLALFLFFNIFFQNDKINVIKVNKKLNDIERYNIIYNEKNCEATSRSVNKYIKLLKKISPQKYSKAFLFFKFNGKKIFSKYHLILLISYKCNIDLTNLIIYNLMTELGTGACTTIIYRNNDTKDIYLLSNLDWGFEDILIISKYHLVVTDDNDNIIYESLSFLGMTGFSRIKTNKWSLAFNLEYSNHSLYEKINYFTILEMLLESAEKDLDFDGTVSYLLSTKNYAGGFYILINNEKGCIITKYLNNLDPKIECINEKVNYLVQTNTDRNSNVIDKKRNYGEDVVKNVKNYQEIFEALKKSPLFVKKVTNFTTISKNKDNFKYKIHMWEKNV